VSTQLNTEQLVAALAQGALQFAGPEGIAASALIPAAEQLVDTLKASGSAVFSVDDLAAIVAKGNLDLAQLTLDVDAI
jgi:hypothetical protein